MSINMEVIENVTQATPTKRKPGRPAKFAPWFPAVAKTMANDAPKGFRSCDQQNQQLDLEGGCNAAKSRDLEVWGCFRSPPPPPPNSFRPSNGFLSVKQ